MTKRKAKTILVVSDLHVGHKLGLCHPDHWSAVGGGNEVVRRKQEELWHWWNDTVSAIKPHAVICAGDLIDGDGNKNAGREQLSTDLIEQAWHAELCLQAIGGNPDFYLLGGTRYHTGQSNDFEKIIAKDLNAKCYGDHENLEFEGVVFNVRHHCGNTSVPYGAATGVLKEHVVNKLKAFDGEEDYAQVVIRAHAHKYIAVQDSNGIHGLATSMRLPAMQGGGTEYGARICTGQVQLGFVVFNVLDGDHSFEPHIAQLVSSFKKTIKG